MALLFVVPSAVWAQAEPLQAGAEITVREKQPAGTPAVGPRAARNNAGEFVVTWREGTAGTYGAWLRRYDADGEPIGPAVELPGNDTASQFGPDVAVNPNVSLKVASGGTPAFAVVWTRPDALNTFGVFARRFRVEGDGIAAVESEAMAVDVGTTTDGQFLSGVGNQDAAQVAMDGDGNFMVVWRSHGEGIVGAGGQTGGIFARMYAASTGTWGPIRLLTGAGARSAQEPAVAASSGVDGRFVATWQEVTSTERVMVRLFDADGTPIEAAIAATQGSSVGSLSIGVAGNGDFVVAAHSTGTQGTGIYAWSFNRDGVGKAAPDGGKRVDTVASTLTQYTSVGVSAGGGFVVAFHVFQSQGSRIFGQQYSSDGGRVGGNFQINDLVLLFNPFGGSFESALNPDVAVVPDQQALHFVAVWNEGVQAFGGIRIAARSYRTDVPVDPGPPPGPISDCGPGTPPAPASDETIVNTLGGVHAQPHASMNGSGEFIVVWSGAASGVTVAQDILFRRYRADGTPIDAAEVQVNTRTADDQISPDVGLVPLPDSLSTGVAVPYNFVVVWDGPADGSGGPRLIWGRRYRVDAFGNLTAFDAADLSISPGETTSQLGPRVAMDENGNIMVVWWGDTNVRVRRFDAAGGSWGPILNINDMPAARAFMDIDAGDGRFVATWHRGSFFNNQTMAAIFNEAGGLIGGPILVGAAPASGGRSVGVGPGGAFTIAASPTGGDGFGVGLWSFESDGTPRDPPDFGRPVNDAVEAEQTLPSVGLTADGGTVVVFQSVAAGGFDVLGQYYTGAGIRYTSNFEVSVGNVGSGIPLDLDVNPVQPNPHFVVVWTNGDTDVASNVHFRLYEPTPLLPAGVDLQVAFVPDQQTVVRPGATLPLRFTVANVGDAPAFEVIVETNRLPADVTPLSSSPEADTSQEWARWELGDIMPGETMDVVLVVLVGTTYRDGDTLAFRGSARGESAPGAEESFYENNSSCLVAQVVEPPEQVDLRINIVPDESTVAPGATLGWTISYGNPGTANATNVSVITDPFPPGISLISSGGATLVNSNGYAEWDLGTVSAGATGLFWFVISVDMSYDPGDILTLRATIQGESDPAHAETRFDNNVSEAAVNVVGSAVDLAISIVQLTDPKAVIQESDVEYRIDYANIGDAPSASVGVRVGPLPEGVTANGPVQWDIGYLNAGGGGSVFLSVHADASFEDGESFSISVTIEGVAPPGQSESHIDNNVAEVTTAVLQAPHVDLFAYIHHTNPQDVAPGETTQYVIHFGNDFRQWDRVARATNVVLRTDPFPPGVTHVSTKMVTLDSEVEWEPSNDPAADGFVRWGIGDIPALGLGSNVTFVMTLRVDAPLTDGDTTTIGVSIGGDSARGQEDLDPANNADSVETPIVLRRPDLRAVMHSSVRWWDHRITYHVLVINDGTDDATDVVLRTGTFPFGVRFVDSDRPPDNDPYAEDHALWTLPDIGGHRTWIPFDQNVRFHETMRFTVEFDEDEYRPGDIVPFSVQVGGIGAYGVEEVNLQNNDFTLLTELTGSWDPNDKQVAPQGRIAGHETLTYMIRFENVGNAPAEAIRIIDRLDPNLDETSLSAITDGGVYDPESRTLQWELLGVGLPPGGTGAVYFAARPRPGLEVGASVRNAAEIVFDSNPPIETPVVVTIIGTPTDLCLQDALVRLRMFREEVRRFDSVKVEGLANQLLQAVSKLEGGLAALRNGDGASKVANRVESARSTLAALVGHVQGDCGKHIDAETAAEWVDRAEVLRARLLECLEGCE